ncbi:MAG: hypothetical protein Q9227_008151 [Pyrenula ochraceoflavens]
MSLSNALKSLIEYRAEMKQQIHELLNNDDINTKRSNTDTIFTEILNSKLSPSEKSPQRLEDEAASLVAAGIETTRWALTVASFYISANPTIKLRLRQELIKAIPNPSKMPTWTQLQNLQYLSACIEEALRLSYGIVQRSPRVSDKSGFTYKSYYIPPGYPVSMDTYHMHHNEDVFPDSHTYNPDRWLNSPRGPDGVKQLNRYMVTFGRGARVCLGMNMAYCELYLILASAFRKFELEPYETRKEDVECRHDFVAPKPKLDSKGVRVIVR